MFATEFISDECRVIILLSDSINLDSSYYMMRYITTIYKNGSRVISDNPDVVKFRLMFTRREMATRRTIFLTTVSKITSALNTS